MSHPFPRQAPRRRSLARALLSLAALLSAAACSTQPAAEPAPDRADLLLTNARVYTVETGQPWAQAVAIRDGHILAVGDDAQLASLRDEDTRVVDLGGRLLLPAFGDAHAHPQFGGISHSRCPLHDGRTLQDYQRIIAACVAASPGDGVVYGVGWEDALFPPNGVPRKEVLDAVSAERPLIFESVGGHSLWLNSRALEAAGITRDTPDPPNGHIDRDPATGEPVGGLQETAMALAERLVPPPTAAEREAAIVHTAKHFNSLGITSWHDAGIPFDAGGASETLDAYAAVRGDGRLSAHVAVAMTWKNDHGLEQLPDLVRASERAEAMGLVARSVKFYVDGVIPQQTAYMLEPYAHAGDARGKPHIDAGALQEAVQRLDAEGFQVHAHAIGDGGVRQALDAIAAARAANGARGGRHMVSHLNVVDPADQPRFGQLGVAAQFQPLWASHYPYMDLTRQAIGPLRSQSLYPAGSILKAGGRLAYGADWPVASANPLEGLQVAVTRTNAEDPASGPLLAGEAVTLEQALRAYTIDVAWVNRMDDRLGSIAPGKLADLVVLDRNIFEIPAHEIGKTRVLLTLFEGRPVFGDLGLSSP
ncbi:amidohydrolase [Luteimonas sp. SDU82]|uniref:amidohydrolase n=1 Tax=Luteimonas sp. SDU82 TaxID=3422592 RepID=UPI003EB75DC8